MIPCGFLYESVSDAYENIEAKSDTKRVLADFVSGKTDALDYVKEIGDIPEEGFVMERYEDYYNWVIVDEKVGWVDVIYIDFDNDVEDELMIRGYTGVCCFFDVIGNTVYKVLETCGTTDYAHISKIGEQKVIHRVDEGSVGRQYCRIMEYDACCCLVDCFGLYAGYKGYSYSAEDRFLYRNREISMEEFEAIQDSIVDIN